MKEIQLTRGLVTLVDDSDWDFLTQWVWHAMPAHRLGNWYAKRGTCIKMHRVILGLSDKAWDADHRDGNGLNNQRSNLRIARRFQNGANRQMNRNNSSGFKGVSWHKGQQEWVARICFRNRMIQVGSFGDILSAASAYDKKAIELLGTFALTNEMLGLLQPTRGTP